MIGGIRSWVGVMLREWPRYRHLLGASGSSYLALCNRNERLEVAPGGKGYRCDWQWTSDLHAPKILPSLGTSLMKRALDEHPVRRAAMPERIGEPPDVTFVIGHRGVDRLPLLLATLESIAGQKNVSIECLVVEQDSQNRIGAELPSWVRHIHTPPPAADMPYCRSWTFNVGARNARGAVLVLHDNDMVVPADYTARLLEHVVDGYEAVNLKRFGFYLSEKHTDSVLSGRAGLTDQPPQSIVQNLEGGGSVAITRAAYERIGGFDESFVGWGGEDNEFWERAQTLRVWPYAYMPIVHLWHAPQAGKYGPDNPTLNRYQALAAIPASGRIAQLRLGRTGEMSGPAGWTSSSAVG